MAMMIHKQDSNFKIIVECRLSAGADPGFDQGGGPDCDRPKTAILGPQFCRILVLGLHFWWSGGPGPPGPPPGSAPEVTSEVTWTKSSHLSLVHLLVFLIHVLR